MIITKSKLFRYKECPLSFNFQYVEKRERDTPPHEYTTRGLEIHNLFNTFFDHNDLSKIPDKYQDTFFKFYQWNLIFNKINKSCCSPKPVSKPNTTLKEFMILDWVKRGLLNPVSETIIQREQSYKALDLFGIVDRINFDGKNYTIIDYKSSFSDLSKLRFELNFYKYLIDSTKLLDNPIRFICSYGYNNSTIFFEQVNQKSYNNMLDKVEAFRKLNFQEIVYNKKPGFHCLWCEYKIACSNTKEQTNFTTFC